MEIYKFSKVYRNRIKDLIFPEQKPQGGRPGKNNQAMFNAMAYRLNTGIPWRDLSERFGS